MASLLPATKWGAAMDFLTYQEVRTTLLVSKMFRKEAVQYVQVLSTSKPSELDVPSALRFKNVAHINICVTTDKGSRDAEMCNQTVLRIVPFLACFPRLAYLDLLHHKDICRFLARNKDQLTRYATLFDNLMGGFQSRALPRLRRILTASHFSAFSGFVCKNVCKNVCSFDMMCSDCVAYCKVFPFWNTIRLDHSCIGLWDRVEST